MPWHLDLKYIHVMSYGNSLGDEETFTKNMSPAMPMEHAVDWNGDNPYFAVCFNVFGVNWRLPNGHLKLTVSTFPASSVYRAQFSWENPKRCYEKACITQLASTASQIEIIFRWICSTLQSTRCMWQCIGMELSNLSTVLVNPRCGMDKVPEQLIGLQFQIRANERTSIRNDWTAAVLNIPQAK